MTKSNQGCSKQILRYSGPGFFAVLFFARFLLARNFRQASLLVVWYLSTVNREVKMTGY